MLHAYYWTWPNNSKIASNNTFPKQAYQSIRVQKLNKTMGERSCSMHSMGGSKGGEKKNIEFFPLKSIKTATQSAKNKTKGIPIDLSLKT